MSGTWEEEEWEEKEEERDCWYLNRLHRRQVMSVAVTRRSIRERETKIKTKEEEWNERVKLDFAPASESE